MFDEYIVIMVLGIVTKLNLTTLTVWRDLIRFGILTGDAQWSYKH